MEGHEDTVVKMMRLVTRFTRSVCLEEEQRTLFVMCNGVQEGDSVGEVNEGGTKVQKQNCVIVEQSSQILPVR